MTAPDHVNSLSHAHAPDISLPTDEKHCPYCNGPVTGKQYRQIRQRIEREGREQLKEPSASSERFANDQQQAAARAKAEIDRAKRDAAAQVAKS